MSLQEFIENFGSIYDFSIELNHKQVLKDEKKSGEQSIFDRGIISEDLEEFDSYLPKTLPKRGYQIRRQVGASGFKIDLGVINPKSGQEFVLGIECDGAAYHSSYSARVNDRLRQDILESLGWKIYRIWSQHWTTHKGDIIEDIIKTIS